MIMKSVAILGAFLFIGGCAYGVVDPPTVESTSVPDLPSVVDAGTDAVPVETIPQRRAFPLDVRSHVGDAGSPDVGKDAGSHPDVSGNAIACVVSSDCETNCCAFVGATNGPRVCVIPSPGACIGCVGPSCGIADAGNDR